MSLGKDHQPLQRYAHLCMPVAALERLVEIVDDRKESHMLAVEFVDTDGVIVAPCK